MIPANYKQAIDDLKWTDKLLMELIEYSRDNHQLGYEPTLLGFMEALNLRDMQNSIAEIMEAEAKYPEGILSIRFDEKWIEAFLHDCNYQAWCKIQFESIHKKEIWSVQNGNEVLTVGDTIVTYEFRNEKRIFKIDYFEISEDSRLRMISLPDTLIYLPTEGVRKFAEEKPYTESDMRKCFEESRLTQPLIGFKYDTFEDFLKLKDKWTITSFI